MKIKTEIIQSIFIVTCDGPSLDASLAQEYLSAMGGFIQKSQMDILLDISGVNFVDSTGLGSVIRSLTEIDGHGQLLICGMDQRTLALLKMAHLDKVIHHESTRDKALKSLFWNEKEESETKTVITEQDFPAKKEATEILSDLTNVTVLLKTEKEKHTTKHQQSIPKKERRQYRRIERKQIMDDELTIFCRNTTTGRHYQGVVLNISPGGLLIATPSKLSIGDELLLEGRIGKLFKFKERAVSRSCRDQQHGLEFIDLSTESTHFLNQLTGAVDMIKSNRFRHDNPN